MTKSNEYRMAVKAPELRAEGDSKMAVGYAAVFNSPTDIGGSFIEQIAPGAFTKSLQEDDVRALYDHDGGRILGRTSAGTCRLKEDDVGLAVEIDLPDTTDGRDLEVLLARGDVSAMSFSFNATHDEWDETVEPPKRTIHEVILREVSAIGDPAYTDTSLALRSRDRAKANRNFQSAAKRLRRKVDLDLRERKV